MGTPAVAAATLDDLHKSQNLVVGVITQPDRPSGRGQRRRASPVRELAEKLGIPVAAPERIRDDGLARTLKEWSPDIIVVVAYGRILPRSILDLPPNGCLNVHYSLLPKYRGAAPVAWAILNGENHTGVTTMRLVEQMDAGPIYLQASLPIEPGETTPSLEAKLTPLGAALLRKTIDGLKEGALAPRDQTHSDATYAPALKKEDGLINWRQTSAAIDRRIRGLQPWPCAYTHYRGQLLKIYKARAVEKGQAEPGIVTDVGSGSLVVGTGGGLLSIEELQLQGRKKMPVADFLRGAKVETGERL